MMNSDPEPGDADAATTQDAAVNAILRSGATGALALAAFGAIIAAIIANDRGDGLRQGAPARGTNTRK